MLLTHVRAGTRQTGAWAYGCYAWSLFALLMLFCGGLIMLFRKPVQGRVVARFGARIFFRLAGVRISAKGIDRLPAKPHLLLVNHTSFLDTLVLTALLPSCPGYAFVARQQFASQRLLCPLVRTLGTLVLRHSNKTHSTGNVHLLTAALRHGESLAVFPEGGFAREAGLKPFHSGAFVAAANAGVPVVVAGLRGTRTALPLGTWLPRRAAITLEIGPTFMPSGTDADSLLELNRAARVAMVPLSGEFETSEQ
jgi:1-acyl-sn-glycerol-3-phosphate acyltransferase